MSRGLLESYETLLLVSYDLDRECDVTPEWDW